MLEKLIGDLGKESNMETFYFWKWADAHPLLHTVIELSGSISYVVIFFGAYMVVKYVMKRKTEKV
jgi:hypothetical protein